VPVSDPPPVDAEAEDMKGVEEEFKEGGGEVEEEKVKEGGKEKNDDEDGGASRQFSCKNFEMYSGGGERDSERRAEAT